MDLNLDLNVICRVCLCDGDMRPLDTESDMNGYSYKDKILQCTNIQLNTHTNFPELICGKCVDDLEIAYRFRMNCESSDAILKMYVDSNGDGTLSVKKEDSPETEALDYEETFVHEYDYADHNAYGNEELDHYDQAVDVVVFDKPTIKKEKNARKSVKKKAKDGAPIEECASKKSSQICELCGSQCRSNFEMKIHMRRHNNEKPFECNFCEKTFAAYGGLKVHLRVHTGEKPYQCKHCDRKFADFTTRIKHERTHTGERPYLCPHCDKTFSYSHVLANHIMTHTGEKKFYCHVCGKGFVKRHNLKIHQNVHLREEGKPVTSSKKKKQPATEQADTNDATSSSAPPIVLESPAVLLPIDSCGGLVVQSSEMVSEAVQVVEVRTELATQFMYDV